jgi:hypothetical protein
MNGFAGTWYSLFIYNNTSLDVKFIQLKLISFSRKWLTILFLLLYFILIIGLCRRTCLYFICICIQWHLLFLSFLFWPHFPKHVITPNNTRSRNLGFLWMRDRSVAEISTSDRKHIKMLWFKLVNAYFGTWYLLSMT